MDVSDEATVSLPFHDDRIRLPIGDSMAHIRLVAIRFIHYLFPDNFLNDVYAVLENVSSQL